MLARMVLLAGAMMASSAVQAQYAPYAPPPEPYLPYGDVPQDSRVFSGVRIEAHLSYDRLKPDLDDNSVFNPRNRDGLGFGGEVGFDFPVGPLTLGGYASVDGSTIRECQRPAAGILGGITTCVRDGRNIAAGGRIGVPLSRSLLLFGKGGYSNGLIRGEVSQAILNGNRLYRETLDGWHVGGGVEAAVGARSYAKIEYIYTRLRNFTGGATDPDDYADFDRQQVQGAFGVRF